MKPVSLALVFLSLLLNVGGTLAKELKSNGNELIGQCRNAVKIGDEKFVDQPGTAEAMYCLGLARGIREAFDLFPLLFLDVKNGSLCFPSNVTNGQLVRVVYKFLRDNPEILNQGSAYLILMAYADAFPCDSE